MRRIAWLMLLGLAACGDEDRTQTDYTASNEKTSTSRDERPAVPAPAAPGANDTSVLPLPPAGSIGLSLRPLGGDSSGGAARLRAQGRRTVYSVQLSRAAAGHAYAGEIRLGVCAQPGPSLTSLNPAVVDSAGRGAAAGDVAVPLDSLLSSAHVLVYGRGGRPEACGEIRPGAPAPAPTADSARS